MWCNLKTRLKAQITQITSEKGENADTLKTTKH